LRRMRQTCMSAQRLLESLVLAARPTLRLITSRWTNPSERDASRNSSSNSPRVSRSARSRRNASPRSGSRWSSPSSMLRGSSALAPAARAIRRCTLAATTRGEVLRGTSSVAPGIERRELDLLVVARGEDDDGRALVTKKRPHRRVDIGGRAAASIAEHGVEPPLCEQRPQRRDVGDAVELEALRLERALQRADVLGVAADDEAKRDHACAFRGGDAVEPRRAAASSVANSAPSS